MTALHERVARLEEQMEARIEADTKLAEADMQLATAINNLTQVLQQGKGMIKLFLWIVGLISSTGIVNWMMK